MKIFNNTGITCIYEQALFRILSTSEKKFEEAAPHQLRRWLKKTEELLSKERRRGHFNHYRYSLNRHIALAHVKQSIKKKLGL